MTVKTGRAVAAAMYIVDRVAAVALRRGAVEDVATMAIHALDIGVRAGQVVTVE